MIRLPIYQVDAFTSSTFKGNPAAVVPLEKWLSDALMQNIALENNLAETAFFVKLGPGHYHLRWFTPTVESPLCGHATLASAYVILTHLEPELKTVRFESMLSPLEVGRTLYTGVERLVLDFPVFAPQNAQIPAGLLEALGLQSSQVLEVFEARNSFYCVLEDEAAVCQVKPDMALLERVEARGAVVTAPGQSCDFVSRFFAPRVGIPEDPVTGSIHTTLIPYWAARLNKLELHARQVSTRGGELWCKLEGDRVLIAGQVAPYLEGFIEVPSLEENRALE